MRHPPVRAPRLTAGALLAAVLLLGGCASRTAAPAFTTWPEELRIRGSLLVLGDGVAEEAVRARFLELAGGEQARVVEVTLGEAGGGQLAALRDATGVWVREGGNVPGSDGPAIGDALAAALAGVVERGGVVAGQGRAGSWMAEAVLAEDGGPAAGLGLMPGVVLHPDFRVGIDRSRLLTALEGSPRLFGVGVPADAALELSGRRLRALAGEVALLVPAGNDRAVREERLRAGAQGRANQADLTAWRREAIERTLPPFPGPAPDAPVVASGTLIIVGGGNVPAVINEAFREAAGGASARLLFIPPEEADELPSEPGIVRTWQSTGVAEATYIHTKDRRRADSDPAVLDPIRRATGIWFGGGRQWNFSDSYYGTEAHRLMHEVLARGGVIAGTSAGASIQAEWMARGDPIGNQNILAYGYERGLGFITGVAIDQHFTQRGRHPDMEELMAVYPQLLGIGIDESTAIVVRGSVAEVIGNGSVFFYDRRTDRASEPVVLTSGGAYDLRARRVLRTSSAPSGRGSLN